MGDCRDYYYYCSYFACCYHYFYCILMVNQEVWVLVVTEGVYRWGKCGSSMVSEETAGCKVVLRIRRKQHISGLISYNWQLIRNDPDPLIFGFPTTMIATGLNVPESLLSISMINYSIKSSMWSWHSG